jgi:hypothetical protein
MSSITFIIYIIQSTFLFRELLNGCQKEKMGLDEKLLNLGSSFRELLTVGEVF